MSKTRSRTLREGQEVCGTKILTASRVTNDEMTILDSDRGDGLYRDALLDGRRLGAVVRGWRMVLLRGGLILVRVAVWHVGRVRIVEVDWRIMALVDMVCVHDMTVACIAQGGRN